MKRSAATRRGLALALCLTVALGVSLPVVAGPDCGDGDDMDAEKLYGLWEIRLWSPNGSPEAPTARGAMLLARHPQYPDSVRGELRLMSSEGGEERALVAGDVDGAVFQLDESDDGQRISAIWEGQPQPCGHTIRGQRRQTKRSGAAPTITEFLLTKQPD